MVALVFDPNVLHFGHVGHVVWYRMDNLNYTNWPGKLRGEDLIKVYGRRWKTDANSKLCEYPNLHSSCNCLVHIDDIFKIKYSDRNWISLIIPRLT